jgi:hypothetical protein
MSTPIKKPDESQQRIARNLPILGFMALLACLYTAWMAYSGVLTGNLRMDGSIGMLLGLYVCSHPAANMLDMLLFMQADIRETIISTRAGQFWLGMNALVLVAGWVAIFSGAVHFVQR